MNGHHTGARSHVTPRRPDLLAAEHDLDGITAGAAPRRSIVVCTAPGSRSDAVADLLHRCGAGVPMEYFDIDAVAEPLSRRWRVINLDDYVTALHRHRSADSGVFGLLLHWRHLRRLHRQVAGLKQLTAERIRQILTTIAPNPTYVLVRGTGPAQVPSAEHTDEPRVASRQVALRQATEQAWLQWFEETGATPLQVTVGQDGVVSPSEEALVDALGLRWPSRTGR